MTIESSLARFMIDRPQQGARMRPSLARRDELRRRRRRTIELVSLADSD
ncbi:MAG: hypothetical protein ACR2O6_11140 [Ilumatobacteraceae bacterium]